jgi:hypothetical protein
MVSSFRPSGVMAANDREGRRCYAWRIPDTGFYNSVRFVDKFGPLYPTRRRRNLGSLLPSAVVALWLLWRLMEAAGATSTVPTLLAAGAISLLSAMTSSPAPHTTISSAQATQTPLCHLVRPCCSPLDCQHTNTCISVWTH